MTDRQQRADARRNHGRILEVARIVVEEQGTQASLRDIARRAEVGMGTLYRHFPTREALLEALLRQRFDHLAARAGELAGGGDPHAALLEWLREFVDGAAAYRGLSASMMTTIGDESSPLHASCAAMREAAGRLLRRAQDDGRIRPDVTRIDLFALVNAVGWIAEQAPSLAARRDHLFSLVMDGLAAGGVSGPGRRPED
ncbi:TetR/AcrR family transcriptional regulator [Microbispora triticiradicis]|uniref:TetR/AcrR family transcriptional regulator n=3 Tax=Microbispora TaxID=2005 RepID=A0ABY3M4A7_9ACTN|nr:MULTISPECIES: TetR/AcrR family transcriptional regulator [Microbispora]RGA01627.1 TetR/AcrR family transcriptional regulator [Microbispora triticiradicis]TLP56921.1 TetR/AcrR family transcriptional regulator [Microbispora fusca]TYB66876.1 TetR/AcrR family transcriptional regulator [Microbispora tritici]GLW26335.1 TetR family transcriptional regulator [Microbispora amethystogenes]